MKKKVMFVEYKGNQRCFDCSAGDHVCKVNAERSKAWDRAMSGGTVFNTIPAGVTCERCEAEHVICYFPLDKDADANMDNTNWEETLFKTAYRLGKGIQKFTEEQELAADGQERIADALERIIDKLEESDPPKVDDTDAENADDMQE
jgi:hypothetical protein